MTNENYTQMSNEELCDIVLKFGKKPCYLPKYLKNHQKHLLDEIIKRTSFLEPNISVFARTYCLEHNLQEHPTCSRPNCTNKVKWTAKTKSFMKYCCFDCAIQDPEYWNGMHDTMEKRFGKRHALQNSKLLAKAQSTCERHYGVKCNLQLDEFRKQIAETNIKLFGVSNPMQSIEIQNKVCDSLEKHYGVRYPLQSKDIMEKTISTNRGKYGVNCVFQSENIKKKIKETCKKTYGVEYYAQSSEFHKKSHKRYYNPKYSDMTFGSSWEFKVYDFLMENHIDFEYQPSISMPYEYEGTHHTYHPDFLVDGKVYEVKGNQFFRINESTSDEEMFCPYRDEDWTDEKYDWMCGLYEAKHQCMLANNVVILREHDIENISTDMFFKF